MKKIDIKFIVLIILFNYFYVGYWVYKTLNNFKKEKIDVKINPIIWFVLTEVFIITLYFLEIRYESILEYIDVEMYINIVIGLRSLFVIYTIILYLIITDKIKKYCSKEEIFYENKYDKFIIIIFLLYSIGILTGIIKGINLLVLILPFFELQKDINKYIEQNDELFQNI